MPLQTTTPSLQNTLRNRLQDPFSEEERKKMLGNNTALQSQLDSLSGSLGAFDPSAERGARTGLLEQQAQQARENIARTFALDPSGIRTGAAIRPFSAIEGARLSNLAALESELSQRAGAENRANLGALQSLQGQQQGLNLNAAQLGLQGLGQLQNQVQFDSSQALQNEQFGRQLGEQGRQFDSAQSLQNEQFGRQLGEQGRQFDSAQSLQNDQFGRQLGEQGRQFDAQQQLAIEQALGNIGGIDTLANRQLTNQIGINNRAQTLAEQSERGRQVGLFKIGDESDRETLANRQLAQQGTQFTQSLREQQAARQQANQLALTELTGRGSREIAPGVYETFDTLASQQLGRQLGLSEAELFGGEVLRDAQGNPVLGNDGQPILRNTLAQQQLNQQAQQFRDTLGLQREELFGTSAVPRVIYDPSQGAGQLNALLQEARPLLSNEEFNALESQIRSGDIINDPQKRLDIVRDTINNKTKAQQTLAQQQLDLQRQQLIDERYAQQEANALQRLGLTGTEGGTETISLQQLRQQDAQFGAQMSQRASEFARQYGLQEAELFGGGPSVTFTAKELVNTPMNTRQGDPTFRPELDIDGNGVYEFKDFIAVAQNSADLGNGVRQFIPEDGRRTLAQQQLDQANANAAREFGIEQARLDEATRQFDQQFGQAKNEWQTATTGYIFDSDGNVQQRWDIDERGNPVQVPLTTLEREQFVEQKRQFNDKLNFDVEALADRLDIDLKKIDAQKFAALMGVVGSIANTAGTIIGNRNNTGTSQNFTTVNSNSPGFGVGFGTNGLTFG